MLLIFSNTGAEVSSVPAKQRHKMIDSLTWKKEHETKFLAIEFFLSTGAEVTSGPARQRYKRIGSLTWK